MTRDEARAFIADVEAWMRETHGTFPPFDAFLATLVTLLMEEFGAEDAAESAALVVPAARAHLVGVTLAPKHRHLRDRFEEDVTSRAVARFAPSGAYGDRVEPYYRRATEMYRLAADVALNQPEMEPRVPVPAQDSTLDPWDLNDDPKEAA